MNTFADPATEIVILASLLQYPEAYYQALAMGLRAEYFSTDQNRDLFRAILRLGETDRPIAFEAVLSELEKTAETEKLVPVLQDLINPLHMPRKNVEWHVNQLREKTRRRQLVAACQRTERAAQDASETTDDCFGYWQHSLLEIEADSIPGQANHLKDFMPQVLRNLEARSTLKGLIGLGTGIPELDSATTGIRPGELWVIGAMSGRGKTSLGAQIALANVASGTPVAFFSLEMTPDELGCRFLCNESGVSASRIRNPRFISKRQWVELAECAGKVAMWPLHIDASSSLTIQGLLASARLYIRRFGCRLVIVDYLRLIKAPGRELREQVGNATDALRQLAKTEQVAVIALSQLARPRDGKINARPTMLLLKESGDIEAHAHVVLLIYMPAKQGEPTRKDEIIIGKNRHGPMGTIEVTFSRERLKFLPRSQEESDADGNTAMFDQDQTAAQM